MVIVKLIIGLVLLVIGAEALVKGAAKIAIAAGITPLVIGLTIVAFGTSSPELAVSVMAVMEGNPDICLGNVVGSNIFNVLFILGISALIVPLVVAQQLIRLDVPVMIAASLLMLLFGYNGNVAWWEGLILLTLGIAYTVFIIIQSKKEKNKEVLKEYQQEYGESPKEKHQPLWLSIVYVLAGLALLILGSNWLVDGAVYIAASLGVSDMVIGLTIIAAGTSLPEVATSIVASLRGEKDIAVGNVVGSNIFNIVYILGIASMVSGSGLNVPEAALRFDLPVMIAVAVSCLPIFFTGRRLDRWEGGIFILYYIAYTLYLILASLKHATLGMFSQAMVWFVIPLTILTLGVLAYRDQRKKAE